MAVLALIAISFMVLSAINGGEAVMFTVQNKCPYTVWAGALPGGGKEVPKGPSWQFDVPAGTAHARIWGRTGCTFDANGHGSCKTGDCGGQLNCQLSGAPPTTLVEYTLNGDVNKDKDTYDISLIDGFNVPMSMVPTKAGCPTTACTAEIPAGTGHARIWGRTDCTFDDSGHGSCKTGDCGGQLNCMEGGKEVSGAPPTTLAEYTLTNANTDTYDISLVDGFNVPVSMVPTKAGCPTIGCTADINAVCPADQKKDGGCLSACNVQQTDQYCCRGALTDNCPPTDKSMIFKSACPQAYSYAKDDQSSTFHCPPGGDYNIIFCTQ